MKSETFFRIAIIGVVLGLFAVAWTLYYQYEKTAEYVCYYGKEMRFGTSYSGLQERGLIGEGKAFVNFNNIKCVHKTESDFVCPDPFVSGERQKYNFIYKPDLERYVTNIEILNHY
jgi:hypothetical protein